MRYHVYITASQSRGTLYVGITDDIARRIVEHRQGTASKFTARYKVTRLVHAEEYATAADAIAREKSLKRWRRAWKIALIEKDNPHRHDLFKTMPW